MEILPLMRYLLVLTKQYPKPLTPKQLAKISKVSLPAVSKVRDKLYPICDKTHLAARRRTLQLRNEPSIVIQLAVASYLDSKLSAFFKTPYFQTTLRKWLLDANHAIAKAFPAYTSFFEENDLLLAANLFLECVVDGLSRINSVHIVSLDQPDLKGALVTQLMDVIEQLGPSLKRHLTDHPQTLPQILRLRDKTWYFALYFIEISLPNIFSKILQTLPDDTSRQAYISVYFRTAKFYLENTFFRGITESIKQVCVNAGVHWNETYSNLGSFFTPTVLPDNSTPKNPPTIVHRVISP